MNPERETEKKCAAPATPPVPQESLSDADLRDLVSEADLLEVTREQLDAFDESTFATTGVDIPPDLADPRHIIQLLEEAGAAAGADQRAGGSAAASGGAGALGFHFHVPPERVAELVPLVTRAYIDVRSDWSTDYTVAEPELNLLFLQRCWQLGAAAAPQELNWTLLNARKDGFLQGLPRARAFSIPRERMDAFSFASEIALRHLQDRARAEEALDLSLDKLLCNPRLAAGFDRLAARLAPGFSPLEYRWAAITLRKARRSGRRTTPPSMEDWGRADDVRVSRLKTAPGVYWMRLGQGSAFVGVAENLRVQVDCLLQATGPRIVPEWVDDRQRGVARLFVLNMPGTNQTARERQRTVLLGEDGSRLNFVPPAA